MQIINNSDIQHFVKNIHPIKIAVAYIGADWDIFVNPESIQEIIVSPTIGSNPIAIYQLVSKLGWEKIYFLDNLHAKFYIGNEKAIIGSFNLSRNGITESGLEELGIITGNDELIQKLHVEFVRLKNLASLLYQSQEQKEDRLRKLYKDYNKSVCLDIIKDTTRKVDLFEWASNLEISIMGYRNIKAFAHDYTKISKVDNDLSSDDKFTNLVKNEIVVSESDAIEENTWLLMWETKKDGFPRIYSKQIINIKWMYIHRVISQGADFHTGFTKLLVERNDLLTPIPPFNINSESFKQAFKEVISTDEFSVFRFRSGDTSWNINNCKQYNNKFLTAILKYLSKNTTQNTVLTGQST